MIAHKPAPTSACTLLPPTDVARLSSCLRTHTRATCRAATTSKTVHIPSIPSAIHSCCASNAQARTAKGTVVPRDVERRKNAKAAITKNGAQKWESRKQQIALAAFIFVPHALAAYFQTGPTVAEQVTYWVTESYAQLTDGKVTPVFQLAVAALFIERMCQCPDRSNSEAHAHARARAPLTSLPLR